MKRKAGKKERPARAGKADKVKGSKAEKEDKKSGKRAGQAEVADDDEGEDDEDDDTLEQQYASKPSKSTSTPQATTNDGDDEDDQDSAMDVEATNIEATSPIPADDAKKNKKDRRVKKTKYTPEGESEVDRDRRTVFVGNVDVEILKSKVSARSSWDDFPNARGANIPPMSHHIRTAASSRFKTNSKPTSSPSSQRRRSNRSDSGPSPSPHRRHNKKIRPSLLKKRKRVDES